MCIIIKRIFAFICLAMGGSAQVQGIEVNERVDVGLAGRTLLQHGIYHDAPNAQGRAISDRTRGAVMTDLTLDLHPGPNDTVWV
jgi:hypothetical protein